MATKAILVVDACRNDPSQSTSLTRAIGLNATRSPIATGPGLAQPFLRPGSKTLVAFATRPGTVAYDGKPGNRERPYVEAMQVRRDDVALVRGVVGALADPAREAEARALLRERFAPVAPLDLKALLAAAPLEGVDLERDRDMGRPVEL